MFKMLPIAALLAGPLLSATAVAQDDYYGDSTADAGTQQKQVREIVKGTYAKTNVGSGLYLGRFASFVSAGTSIALAAGQDFIDQESMSMAWEISFFQGINNAAHYQEQADAGCFEIGTCMQGDLRTYTFVGLVEYSWYPSRRLGIGIRTGGGILFSPLLMNEKFYNEDVVQKAWHGFDPTIHKQPHPLVTGGPTIEYYTKLSHFSVGIDTDVFYAVQFDIGMSITGTLKYTF